MYDDYRNPIIDLVCKECGKEFDNIRSFSAHIYQQHTMKKLEYLEKYYGDTRKTCLECDGHTIFRGWAYQKFCSPKCCGVYKKKTNTTTKYWTGKKQSKEQIEKRIRNTDQKLKQQRIEETNIKKYGVKNVSQLKNVKRKIININTSTTGEFISKANSVHGDTYNYSLVEYVGHSIPVKIICDIHGEFEQKPTIHIKGSGCPICNNSKGETKILQYLIDNNITYIYQHTYDDCKHIHKLPFDFFIPSHNMCIEYDGEQHFNSVEFFGGDTNLQETQYRDSIKTNYCLDNNINLLRIPYTKLKCIDDILNDYLT